jgi:TonB-linked SusC/RagA family outer membrane protein
MRKKQVLTPKALARRFLFILATCLSFSAAAQVRISGKITDARGSGLAGISVIVRNTTTGTTTDASGNYSLSADLRPGQYILDVSGIGYKSQEFAFTAGTEQNFSFDAKLQPDALGLDEVVVTGTNVRTSKKQLGNAVSTVSSKQLQNTGAQNLSAMLSGKVMGAQVSQNSGDPAGGVSITLRGIGSIFGSSEPLYIIDGVIFDNSSANVVNLNADAQGTRLATGANRLVDLNPNDIERIEVINGAAAAAVYGSRAANGVVQIFTKKGVSGKAKVTLSLSVQRNSLRKDIPLNNTPLRFGIAGDARLSTVGDRLTTIANLRTNQAVVPGAGPASLGGRLDLTKYPVTRYNYWDDVFESSTGTDNHISVTGGNDKASYYFSGSYLRNDGIIRNTNFQRYGFKGRTDVNINRWIKLSGGLMYTNSRSKDLPNGNNFFSPISTVTIIDNVWDIKQRDINGNLQHVERTRMNPLSITEGIDIRQEINRTLADVKLMLTPVKGLSIDITNGFDNYSQAGNTYQPRVPYEPLVAASFFPDGYVSYARYNFFQWSNDITATYRWNITNKIVSTTTAGYSGQYIKTNYAAQEGRDLIPLIKTISAAQNLFSLPVDRRTEQSIFGWFAQQNFGYDNKLFVTIAGRFDGSSAFGRDAQNIFYPKASISYNISNEKFWKGNFSNWFNTMKLRASWGKAGNLTGIGAYDRFIAYQPINYTGGGFGPQNRIGNEDIRPEIKTELEVGADMQFLKGRLGLQFTVYNQKITDLVLPFNIAPSNGAASILDNLGKMTNKGFELMLTGVPVSTKDFRWDISLLFNRNRNKVTEVYRNATFIGLNDPANTGVLLGYPVGVYYINYFARKGDGSYLLRDVNGFLLPQVERGDANTNTPQRDANGQPTGVPLRKILGDPNPDYTATLSTELTYRKWSLRMQWDRVAGFEVYNWDWITRNNVGTGPTAQKELNGELPRGWTAAIGGFIGPRIQEDHVEDGSFTKLRELALSFNLGRVKFANNVRISLVGRNLLSIDNYRGFDPEVSSSGQSVVRGNDFGAFPIPRTYQLSIVTNF